VHYYTAFGGVICSEVSLPELSLANPGVSDWTLVRSDDLPEPAHATLLGSSIKGSCEVSLWKTDAGYRMRHSCVGDYDIARDGSLITCRRSGAAPDVSVQNDVVGRILPLVFHGRGALCLHASAAELDGGGIAFVADPRYGKSTLAYALVRAGARLVSDDVVIVDTPAVTMRRGVEQLRLCADASEHLMPNQSLLRSDLDGKDVLQLAQPRGVAGGQIPLRAIYLLAPFSQRGRREIVHRQLVAPRAAAMLLMRHARFGRLLCGTDGGKMLARAAAIAREVPVYTLHVARNLSRIDEAVQRLVEWHEQSIVLATGTSG
jgi:hypothetical protein